MGTTGTVHGRRYNGNYLQIQHCPNKLPSVRFTRFWYNKWKEQKKLKPFDYTKKYPLGTILFRKYRDVKDQGHFAVLYSYNKKHPDKILYGEIIHAYGGSDGQVGQV